MMLVCLEEHLIWREQMKVHRPLLRLEQEDVAEGLWHKLLDHCLEREC